MQSKNPYWGRPYVDLEELYTKYIFMAYDARLRGDQKELDRINREMTFIQDAMTAYVRGDK